MSVSRAKNKPDSKEQGDSLEELCSKLEAALLDQISRAEKGHGEIAESAGMAQEALDHLVEKVTARRVNAVSRSASTGGS